MLKKLSRFGQKGVHTVVTRLREQGVRTTLLWVWGRGTAKLTGVPPLRFSEVTPQLYVGPQFDHKGKRHLENSGITAVVNLRVEYDDAAHGLTLQRYCHLPTIDDASISPEHLNQGADFIREVITEGGKVYIHCAGGIGRAPTMAAAYLISEGKTVDEAMEMIRRVRPFINPTAPQRVALQEFARAYAPQSAD
jgi:protein-tyrosine phosphatase